MTLRTALASGASGKLAAVDIAVTIGAIGKGDAAARAARFMAAFARQVFVTTNQGKPGNIMIKTAPGANLSPALCRVTTGAVLPKPSLVNIAVTGGAVSKRNAGKLYKRWIIGAAVIANRRVTRQAFQRFMPAGKLEAGPIVIKSSHRCPVYHTVTLAADGGQLPTVFIPVAAQAIRLQPQEGTVEVYGQHLLLLQ